jgi:tRNA(adenine34) deaminase
MEPCAMCAGAIINARIPRVVYGTRDVRFGAFGSLIDLSAVGLNHTPEIVGGVMEDETRDMLTAYFRRKRKQKKDPSSEDALS